MNLSTLLFRRLKNLPRVPSLLVFLLALGVCGEVSLRARRLIRDPDLRKFFHSNQSLYSTDLIRKASEPRLGFLLKPNLHTTYKGKEFSTNAQGFRDRNRSLFSPPQTRRIAVLGRSYEMGTAVADGEAWPQVLEKLLNPYEIEVLNFGVEGHTLASMETVYHRFAKNYHPDWVILPVYYEEIDSLVPTKTPAPASPLRKWTALNYYLDALYLPRFLQFQVWQHVLGPTHNDWMYLPRTDRMRTLGAMTSQALPSTPVEPYIQVVQRLVASIQSEGSEVIVVPMPRVIPPYQAAYSKGKRLYEVYSHHRKGLSFFKELESLQSQLTAQDLDIPGDPHFNANFHRVLAQKVFQSFESKILKNDKKSS